MVLKFIFEKEEYIGFTEREITYSGMIHIKGKEVYRYISKNWEHFKTLEGKFWEELALQDLDDKGVSILDYEIIGYPKEKEKILEELMEELKKDIF